MKYFILFTALVLSYFNYAQNWHPSTDTNWEIVFEDNFNQTYGSLNVDPSKWYSSYPWNQGRHGAIVTKGVSESLLPPEIAYLTRNFENIVKPSPGTIAIEARKETQPYRGEAWDWSDCDNCLDDYHQYPHYSKQAYSGDADTIEIYSNGNTTIYYSFYNNAGELDSLYNCDMNINQDDTSFSCFNKLYFNYTHTQGVLTSKKHFKYGFYELKFRIPEGNSPASTSSGAAWWMFEKPDLIESELDFFEINADQGNYYAANLHYKVFEPNSDNTSYEYHALDENEVLRTEKAINADWHIATCLWTKDYITSWIDGEFVANFPRHADDLDPMYMILATSYPADNYGHADITKVPNQYLFEIDYVKVYQKKQRCNTVVNNCNLPLNPIEGIQKSISAGGNNCNYILNPNAQNSYYAKDFIFLDKGFESQLGTVFEGVIEDCPTITPRLMAPKPSKNYNKTMQSIGNNKLNNALNAQ